MLELEAKLGSLILAIVFYVNLQNSKILVKEIQIPIEYPKLAVGSPKLRIRRFQ
ncbi:hypothetical protein LEP1GSC168_0812 [Leptospira santarosai str. HAI134]|nr:hypothetical protein LEP1GSC168_0812 [Leptospira santarosai str. HAI134]